MPSTARSTDRAAMPRLAPALRIRSTPTTMPPSCTRLPTATGSLAQNRGLGAGVGAALNFGTPAARSPKVIVVQVTASRARSLRGMTHRFDTLAIHAGQEPEPVTGAVVPPIFATSTYRQDGVGAPREGYEYSRTANPTRRALEECLAALESGRRGLAFASGMAAEDTLLRTVCGPGDHVVIP